jgi:polar amino acid transport system substrate-binding protein
VNAGFIPKSHWIQAPEQGGRIIGEVCHFIDCMVYLSGAIPVKVYAEAIGSGNTQAVNHDSVSITIRFSDGSTGSILYLANGDASLSKEYCEVHSEQRSAVMDNFKTLDLHSNKKMKQINFNGGKGHAEEIAATVQAIRGGSAMPISYEHIRAVTLATFGIEESLATNSPIGI